MNFFFSSGGVNGIAFIGALEELEKKRIERGKCMSGVSIGALFALLISAGYLLEEIRELACTVSLSDFFVLDPFNVLQSLGGGRLGFDSGALLRSKLEELLLKKGKGRSFTDFPNLQVYAVNLRTRSLVEFSKANPCDVIDAVMASMCLPPIFEPVRINGDLYIDGAVIDGFPFKETQGWIGLYLRRAQTFKPDLLSYLFYVLDIRDEKQLASNVISIDCDGGALQNIHLVRDKLLESGRQAAVKWLEHIASL